MTRVLIGLVALFAISQVHAQPKGEYVKKGTRVETTRATLKSFGMPNLEGKWYIVGPFDNPDRKGHDKEYPPEKTVDLKAEYDGKGGKKIAWQEYKGFELGKVLDLKKVFLKDNDNAVCYLYHEFEATENGRLPVSLGADDTMSLWNNGARLVHEDHERAAAPDQFWTQLKYKPGKNTVLIKICQYGGGWEVYVAPEMPDTIPDAIQKKFEKEFPRVAKSGGSGNPSILDAESAHYKMQTFDLAADCVLEVGGLAFRPDGKLFVCTRRGEVWLVHNPTAAKPEEVKFTKFATGLHEILGIWVQDNNTVYVSQRPEVTKLVDKDGDGKADEYVTVCDKWGVSGDYHEYAFGLPRDKSGNFYVTLNVGFGGGHQSKVPWRGWCVQVDSKTGKMEPYAYGLRSPNGVAISPDGELFYTDNQGEWMASNKLQHVQKGKFHGHQASLRWLKESAFASQPDTIPSGMCYDGNPPPNKTSPKGMPQMVPPTVWFPYGRMGQSISEPAWDTSAGKFGPFAGQIIVGDQNKANLMRVDLQKVNGVYQGACFPFRYGFQCGVNRIAFAPDGSLFVGETNRGWGGLGGKPYGLQRIVYTGVLPFEIHSLKVTKTGFDFTFTQEIDPTTAAKVSAISLKSFTYIYHSSYGCPETDTQPETISAIRVSQDKKTVSIDVKDLRIGRVYDFRINDIRNTADKAPVHVDAYYTLNELVK